MSAEEPASGTRERGRRRSVVVLWALVAVVGVALIVGAVAGALREPAALEAGTPEAAVQAYLQAVIAGEYEQATQYLSAEAAERCDAAELRRADVPERLTATLEEVRPAGDGQEVLVHFRAGPPPPQLGGSGYSYTERFLLVDEGGSWRLSDAPWPFYCTASR